jgi:hypothetical protein
VGEEIDGIKCGQQRPGTLSFCPHLTVSCKCWASAEQPQLPLLDSLSSQRQEREALGRPYLYSRLLRSCTTSVISRPSSGGVLKYTANSLAPTREPSIWFADIGACISVPRAPGMRVIYGIQFFNPPPCPSLHGQAFAGGSWMAMDGGCVFWADQTPEFHDKLRSLVPRLFLCARAEVGDRTTTHPSPSSTRSLPTRLDPGHPVGFLPLHHTPLGRLRLDKQRPSWMKLFLTRLAC